MLLVCGGGRAVVAGLSNVNRERSAEPYAGHVTLLSKVCRFRRNGSTQSAPLKYQLEDNLWTMSNGGSVEALFKEHSFEEIESVRDNLAGEIEKRTELLKSIVKEKYHDVVETSDAIQSMKINLTKVEQSIHNLDRSILEFYTSVNKPKPARPVRNSSNDDISDQKSQSNFIKNILQMSAQVWEYFDNDNIRMSVKQYNDLMEVLKTQRPTNLTPEQEIVLKNIETDVKRSKGMIKNQLLHKIESAEVNQIGVIMDDSDEDGELYELGLNSSMEILVDKFKKSISDTSYQAQIRRYQPCSYFNSQTNRIDPEINDLCPPATGYVQIPRHISVELSTFLYEVCRVINTIAGFSLIRVCILKSLRIVIEQIVAVFIDLLPILQDYRSDSRRKRALQLYFDLTYIRVLLNSSRDVGLIEELDPGLSKLAGEFEAMLDPIELYMVSEALHESALKLSLSTVRLYGLLVPHLQ